MPFFWLVLFARLSVINLLIIMLQLTVIGNLGADAQVKEFNGRKAIVFNVAHTEKWTGSDGVVHDSTTWVSCIWNSEGGNLLQYLRRGATVFVQGRASTRVYSSPKERCMVAGLDLTVSHIELVGGRVDDVPAQLIDADGVVYKPHKCYFLPYDIYRQKCPDGGEFGVLSDMRNERKFVVGDSGVIREMPNSDDKVF